MRYSKTVNEGGVLWVVAVNLTIWTGLFLYLLRIERKIRQREISQGEKDQ